MAPQLQSKHGSGTEANRGSWTNKEQQKQNQEQKMAKGHTMQNRAPSHNHMQYAERLIKGEAGSGWTTQQEDN